MKNIYRILIVVCFIVGLSLGIFAQKFTPGTPNVTVNKKVEKVKNNDEKAKPKAKVKDEKVNERVKQLEAEVVAMRAELDALKKLLVKNSSASRDETVAKAPEPKDRATMRDDIASIIEAEKAKKKKSSDLSFDVGKYRVTPYGIIFFNAFANSNGTNNIDDPLWATSNSAGNAGASGRQTRLGVKVTGGKLGNANVTGVVEADFYGGLPGVGVGENMGVLRLRVAKVQLDWERTSLIIGQDWMIFAPNSPTSLAAAAIPQFAAAGNPWSRLPQVRVERKLGNNFKWQGAILAPSTGDFPIGGATPLLLQPSTGSASKVPFFQSRISYATGNWFGTKTKGTIGFAGHYGQSRISNGALTDNVDSYGAALDWNFPIVKRVTVKGEAFLGSNLGGFQAGIFQGYNSSFASPQNQGDLMVAPGIRGIRTRGGWLQLGWNLPAFEDRLSIYGSFGVDDPRNLDLISTTNRNFRARNFGYAFDAIFKISKHFSVGTEFRRLETTFFRTTKEAANHINVGGKYSF